MTDVAIDPMRIRERAHALWLTRGCAGGSADQDWFEAERAIAAEDSARRGCSEDLGASEGPAIAAPLATRARNVARPRISPSAAVPPTAALSPSAHGDLRREARGEKATMASPAPARAARQRARPGPGVKRNSDAGSARAEGPPSRGTAAPRAQKGTKAASSGRAKRSG